MLQRSHGMQYAHCARCPLLGGRNVSASPYGVARVRHRQPYKEVVAWPNTSSNSACSRIGSASSSESSTDSTFFNRTDEVKALNLLFEEPATGITVITGPRNAGKTALLKHLMDDRGLSGTICFIDGRLESISSPSALAEVLQQSSLPTLAQQVFPSEELKKKFVTALKEAVASFSDKLTWGGSELNIQGKIVSALLGVLEDNTKEQPLAAVIGAYTTLLKVWKERLGTLEDKRQPVLILDEVNVLMTWSEEYVKERQELLRFFIAISKQECSSHVILATSEYAFEDWLKREIGPDFHESLVIGDFAPVEAKAYLDLCLGKLNRPGVADDDWRRVHEVCGGNPGALKRAASLYKRRGNWELALSQMCMDTWSAMRAGYRPGPGAGYTAKDYATAIKAILDSPYNAVTIDVLEAALSSTQPEVVVKAMVAANLLALRPYSPWAKDIDSRAFGRTRRATLVTAPSAVQLYLMQEERGTLLAALCSDVQVDGTPGAAAGVPRPSSPGSNPEVIAAQRRIDRLEDRIDVVEQEVMKAQAQGDNDMVMQLLVREQQLRSRLAQLGEEKLVLLRAYARTDS